MNKDALQSTYNAYMQTNSLVRKKAMKNHNDAMGKVPNKYNDSSKRQYVSTIPSSTNFIRAKWSNTEETWSRTRSLTDGGWTCTDQVLNDLSLTH
jgi:hypothetical protein